MLTHRRASNIRRDLNNKTFASDERILDALTTQKFELLQYLRTYGPRFVRRAALDLFRHHENLRDVEVLWGNCAKFKAATGWDTTIPFETTMRDLLDYWRVELRRRAYSPAANSDQFIPVQNSASSVKN